MYSSTLSLTSALDGVGGQHHAPAALNSGMTQNPLGGLQGRSGRVWKISPPPEFDPRTINPVASRYTDWVIPAHNSTFKYKMKCVYIYIYTYTYHR